MKLMVEEADIWWWVVATNFNVSSRPKFKFYGLSVAFKGLLVANPCLNFCLRASQYIHPKMNGVSKVVTNLCDSGRAALLSVATAGK